MNRAKPLCPGCGKPMECGFPHLYIHETPESLRYICGYRCNDYKCGWGAPIGRGKTKAEALENAYLVAVRRATNEESDIVIGNIHDNPELWKGGE